MPSTAGQQPTSLPAESEEFADTTASPTPGRRSAAGSLPEMLDEILQRSPSATASIPPAKAKAASLEQFLREPDAATAIQFWLGGPFPGDREGLAQRLNEDVAAIDQLLNRQLNVILHSKRLQQLEASWRGLNYLLERVEQEGDPSIKVRVLNLSWRELTRDFDHAIEFDQSQVWRKVYENEFGTPGGQPFGVLLGDFEIHPRLTHEHPFDDVRTLGALSSVAAAAFCPAILGAAPAMFGVDHFYELEHAADQESLFQQLAYLKWRELRERDDSRFVALTAPRVLMRAPYRSTPDRADCFVFEEDVAGPGLEKHLWGTAVYAYGGVLVRAFAQAGWLADIRGSQRGVDGGGAVVGLPTYDHGVDRQGLMTKWTTDLAITDRTERQLSELGFLPLCVGRDGEVASFVSSQSIQKAAKYDRSAATTNARISSMLQYMLCVSRFAHYVKVLGRDKLGSFTEPDEFEQMLQSWLVKYVTADSEAGPATKARYPLRDASVKVEPNPGKPGSFRCQMHLQPHYELDDLQAAIRVVTELAPGRSGG